LDQGGLYPADNAPRARGHDRRVSCLAHLRNPLVRAPRGAVLCLLVMSSFVACRGAATRLTPDRVNVVVSVSPVSAAGPATALLDSGESISIDLTKAVVVAGALHPGDLLIRGSMPGPWLMAVSPEPTRGCFWVDGWGTEDGSSIALDKGPVLSKAADFDRSSVAPYDHRFERSGFCLNIQGQVTSVQV